MFLRRSLLAALFLFATAAFADSIILVGTAPGAPTIQVSVELNPQPFPPAPATTLDLSNPLNPKLVNPGTTPGWMMSIGILEIPSAGPEVIVNFQEGDPDSPILIGYQWKAHDDAGNAFEVLWTDFPKVDPSSWNPQRLPSGGVEATFQVCQSCDPVMGFNVVSLDVAGNTTTYTFQQVAEPGTLSLLAGGVLMATGWRRRR